MNTAMIIKKKKKMESIDSVPGQGFKGTDKVPAGDEMESVHNMEEENMEGTNKVPATGFKGTEKVKPTPVEKSLEISVMLEGAKKKPKLSEKDNAYDESVGSFKVDKDESGMFKETGESKLKKLLKRRGY